jgi:GTP-binding protein
MPLKLAIVGRPNVGKSTLFNRLAGRRIALVDDRPGVTRDRREAPGELLGLDLLLIDTAGFADVSGERLEARMRAQTQAAIADADIVLFLVDARAGVTALDRTFADVLRRASKPVLVGANKCEGTAADPGVIEAFSLGLGEPIALSAEHGLGLYELAHAMHDLVAERAELAHLRPAEADEGSEELPPGGAIEDEKPARALRIAVVGRPNVGKSTLINTLLGEERLITGPEAGITRDAIAVPFAWEGREIELFDTAGMRRRARVNEKLEKLSVGDTLKAIRFADIVIVVMESMNAFDKQDLQIADLVEREGRAILLAVNKWDLVEDRRAAEASLRSQAERLLPQLKGLALVMISGQTGEGVQRLMKAVFAAEAVWGRRVSTGQLNRWLEGAVERHPPPVTKGRRIKLKYITQVKARPPTFVIFSQKAEELPGDYLRYIIGGIRERFEFPGVPIRVELRRRDNPYADR